MRREERLNYQINISIGLARMKKREVASRQNSPERRRDKIKGN